MIDSVLAGDTASRSRLVWGPSGAKYQAFKEAPYKDETRASLVCLVTGLDDRTIYARRIHTQDDVRFDRNTGLRLGKGSTKIDCVTPFQPDIHEIFLEMDRKHRENTELFRKGIEPEPGSAN